MHVVLIRTSNKISIIIKTRSWHRRFNTQGRVTNTVALIRVFRNYGDQDVVTYLSPCRTTSIWSSKRSFWLEGSRSDRSRVKMY